MVGGKVVYASGAFLKLAPPPLSVSPDWSPIKHYGGYQQTQESTVVITDRAARSTIEAVKESEAQHKHRWVFGEAGMWSLGCDCFAF